MWSIDLRSPDDGLAALLQTHELERAGRIRTACGRRRWTVARAGLRALLATYLGTAAREIELSASQSGKPQLAGPSELRFNASHSGDLALVAVARSREVGVDVESTARQIDAAAMARMYLSPDEQAAVERAPNPRDLLLRHWVAIEAFGKATGQGISRTLRTVEVDLDGAGGAQLVGVDGWSLELLDLPDGYVGAVVAAAGARVGAVVPFNPGSDAQVGARPVAHRRPGG